MRNGQGSSSAPKTPKSRLVLPSSSSIPEHTGFFLAPQSCEGCGAAGFPRPLAAPNIGGAQGRPELPRRAPGRATLGTCGTCGTTKLIAAPPPGAARLPEQSANIVGASKSPNLQVARTTLPRPPDQCPGLVGLVTASPAVRTAGLAAASPTSPGRWPGGGPGGAWQQVLEFTPKSKKPDLRTCGNKSGSLRLKIRRRTCGLVKI